MKKHHLAARLALIPLCISFGADAIARPDMRQLVFEPRPAVDGKSAPLALEYSLAENFLSFDKYVPLSYPSLNEGVPDLDAAVAERRARIEDTVNKEGPYSETIGEELVALGHLYQEGGEHGRALETFERAIHISKINHGLFHENQIPVIEASIQSLLTLGRYAEVDEQLDFLIYLHQKHYGPDSIEMIRPLASKVAWDMYLYEQNALLGQNRGQDSDALINGFSGSATAGKDIAANGILIDTQEMIIQGIRILVNAREFANPFLHKFEQQLIETYFYQAWHDEQARATSHHVKTLEGSFIATGPYDYTKVNYQNGEKAYLRLLDYLEKSQQENTMEYVLATLGLGDWYLLFNKLEKSHRQYEQAALLLDRGGFSEQEKREVLQPVVPVELPAFGGTPLFSAVKKNLWGEETPGDFKGYVDVNFDLSRQGRVTNVEIMSQSDGTPKYITTELEWKIRDSRYRPLIAGTEIQSSSPLTVRYYYNY